jgi:hypothetical protein
MNTLLKAFMGLAAIVLFFGGMSYVPDPYGTYIWQGGALGAVTVLAMFVIGAPVAYMLNSYAYKPLGPRLIMGFLGLVSFPIILGLMFFRPKTYYFGLIPVLEGCGAVGGNSLIDYLYAIWCTVVEPFTFYKDSPDDSAKLTELISKAAGYGVGVSTIPVDILEEAETVATIRDGAQWEQAYNVLLSKLPVTQ